MTTVQNDVIEAAARMEYDGTDDVINTYQYRLNTAASVSDGQTVTDIITILELLYTIIVGIQSTFLTYKDIRVTNKTQDLLLGTVAWPTLTVGTGIVDAIPPGVASLSNFNTQVPRVTLRKYYGGLDLDNLDQDGTFTAAMGTPIAAVNAFLLTLQSQGANDWKYGYLSPKTAGFVTPVGSSWTDIPAYQRRRKQGRGS